MARRMLPIAMLLLLAALTPQAASAAGAMVRFSPSSANVAPGDVVPIDVTVAGVDSTSALGGYAVNIAFDPSVVRLDSVVDSGFITSGTTVVICGSAAIDNVTGHSRSVCAPIPLPGSSGVSTIPAKALLHASFTALGVGTSPLDLSGTTLSSAAGTPVAATLSNGDIHVAIPVTPGQGATPTVPAIASPVPLATSPAASTTVAAATQTPGRGGVSPTGTVAGLRVPDTGNGQDGTNRSVWLVTGSVAVVALLLAGGTGFMWARRSRTPHN